VAWEWVGPTGTAVVGLGGIAATYFSGRRQVGAARQVARDQANAGLRAQREERNQRRLEGAYPNLLDVIAAGTEWLWEVDAFMSAETADATPPGQPDGVAQLMRQGSLTAIWSPQVALLVRDWSRAVGSAYSAARRMGYAWEDGKIKPSARAERGAVEFSEVRNGDASQIDYLSYRFDVQSDEARLLEGVIRDQVLVRVVDAAQTHCGVSRSSTA
jgi:hypothetical protein